VLLVSLLSRCRRLLSTPHLRVIAIIAVIVPRRLRADWQEEWQAELKCRERRLADWDLRYGRTTCDLLRRSSSAFWDALSLQRQRREDEVVQDLRFGLRMLVKSPTFTCVAVLTLALGIGANTAVFTFVDALLLRPLAGVTQPDRLVQLGRQYPDKTYLSDSSYPDYVDYRDQNTVLSGLAVVAPTAFHLSTGSQTERVEGELVSSNYFDVLGAAAAHGRLLSPSDDRDGSADPVVVLSYRLWQRRFGGDPSVLGTTVTLNGHDFTIIGVTSEPFAGIKVGTPRDVWVPLEALRQMDLTTGAHFGQRRASWLESFARLKPGVTLEQARAELSAIAQRLERTYPDTNARAGIGVEPGLGRDVDVRRALGRFVYLPLTAVGLVLVIACANVAGLLLARAAARRKEIATRLALGAGRIRVVRQLLTESIVLAIAGGVAGLAIGSWLTSGLRSLLPDRYLFLSFNVDLGLDWRVFGFMLGVATATGVLFGLVPALQGSRPDVVPELKGVRGANERRDIGLRGVLVVTQLALTVILLVAAGLCVRTLRNAAAIDTGYEAGTVLTARMDLARQNYSEARGRRVQQQLLERMQNVPGVDAAGFAVTLPLNDGRWEDAIRRDGDSTRVQTFQNVVSPRYFAAMKIPLVTGRGFSDRDDAQAPRVAILNQGLARILWPGENPIGKRVRFKGQSIDVIGVVRDIKGRNLFEPPAPMFYLPLFQSYQPNVVLHVRAAVSPASLVPVLRQEVSALDKDLPVYALTTLDEHVRATLTPQRLLAYLIGGLGVLALLLAAIGLYGLMAYGVAERTPEIGIRMALGAHKADVMRLFVVGGMKLALSGVILGSIAALGVTPLMKSLLFGISPLDPLTLVMAPALLLLAALVACAVPAHCAAGADPKIALRYE
jgi:macrolide transport system ATP-binding/permease protein